MSVELLPGYYVDDSLSGAFCTLPWPGIDDLPESIGPQLIRWAEGRTDEPGLTHYLTGEPWRFTVGQRKFLHLWYAHENGRFVYRSAVKRGAKGTGKDPFAAAHMILEFIGPSQLVFDGSGWVGARHRMPLVQIGANSEPQARDTLRIANSMLSKDARSFYGLDCGETQTKLTDGSGGRMETLTASDASSEGDPATFIALNESHHMTGDLGRRIADVARRNVGKSPAELQARMVEYTNAHRMGGDSVAEDSFNAWQKQVSGKYPGLRQDILYDSIEADPALRLHVPDELELGLRQAYADAGWADYYRLRGEALDPRTSPGDSIRFYFNGLAASEDAWVDPRKFDSLMDSSLSLSDGDAIAVFLDCSKSEDATGMVACRLSDSAFFVLGMWQKPHGDRGKDWLVPREEVDAAAREAFSRYRVVWFGMDPSPARDDSTEALYWKELGDSLHRDFRNRLKVWATPGAQGSSVVFDMRLSQRGGNERNQKFTETAELVSTLIDESDVEAGVVPFRIESHAGLRMHAHNAKRRPNRWGFTLGKQSRDYKRLVDLAVCMVGARLGRDVALDSGKVRAASGAKKPTERRSFVLR